MSTALSLYQRMPDQLAAVKFLGESIAKSGMFGCTNVEQGNVFAMECMARGEPPLMLQERYHVIFGKLSMKADAMLAGIYEHGATHEIIERTPERAEIEVIKPNGKSLRFAFTWAQAQQEPYIYEGKEQEIIDALEAGKKPRMKGKYRTPRQRMQMLWARVVSDAVRATYPQVNSGVYTPEENGGDEPDAETAAPAESNGTAKGASNGHAKGNGDIVDAEFEVTTGQAKPAEQQQTEQPPFDAGPAPQPEDKKPAQLGSATAEQLASIRALFKECGYVRVQQLAAIENFGVTKLEALTSEDAAWLIDRLSKSAAALKATQPAAPLADKPAETKPEPTEMKLTDPATEVQQARIKELLAELEQVKPGTVKTFKQKIADAGYQKLADFTAEQAGDLILKLSAKNIELFFAESLQAKEPAKN